jgi:flavin reductase (DIM6/NTAB) family NADH-FMN oxidoreductase RutF
MFSRTFKYSCRGVLLMTNISVFKEIMGNYPTGVTIVTTMDDLGTPVGLTVNSFASVSIEPLLILWSIDKKVSSYQTFCKTDRFAVHILAENQGDLCTLFATRGTERFANCVWGKSKHQLPIITGVAGVLQCKTYNRIEAGDHMILIGEVMDLEKDRKEPLLYHKRKFGPIPSEFYM